MNTFQRLLHHLATPSFVARRAFPSATLTEIENIIATGEKTHRAEIRVIIETALSFSEIVEKKLSRTRALELFGLYKIWNTEENTGILIYINLADRKVEIVTDRGINEKIPPVKWQTICTRMAQQFREKHFHDGIATALKEINGMLQTHFPCENKRTNVLPDSPIIL